MNPITPQNIHRHELIGLKVEIIKATDKQMIGIHGLIIDESQNMFTLQLSDNMSNRIMVPKKDCVFRFTLPSMELVEVDGILLKLKPENRLKNVIRNRW